MAFDEALLESAAQVGFPVLRWYAWTSPAATFGYFQSHQDIASWTRIQPLLRRPTGGGLVPHLADWTYAFAVPPGHEWYRLRAPDSYLRMHRWLQSAFALCNLPSTIALCCETSGPGQCFVGWEKSDLLCHGRKLAGAAQRRNRSGLLIQGSIKPIPSHIDRATFAQALREVATRDWAVQWTSPDPAPWTPTASQLHASRYLQDAHHRKR
jgi:lipoate-protein ligase A